MAITYIYAMKRISFIHFLIALTVLIISGTGFFLPAGIAIALTAVQSIIKRFELVPVTFVEQLPSFLVILGACYAANFLLVIISWIL